MHELYEDYSYTSYLAEKEYRNNLSNILESMLVDDTTKFTYVTEALEDAVTKYISKIATSTQQNWDKFSSSINVAQDKQKLKQLRPAIVKFKDLDIVINNYPDFDLRVLDAVKVQSFNYDTMKPAMRSINDFMDKFYPTVNFDNKVSVRKAVKDAALKSTVKKLKLNREFLIDKFNFNAKGYSNAVEKLKAEVDLLNKSNNDIVNMSKSIISNNESINFKTVYEDILLEALPNTGQPKSAPGMTFTDSNGNKLDNKKSVSNSGFIRKVKVYYDVMTGIISAKMYILNKYYKNNMTMLEVVYKQTSNDKLYTDKEGNPKLQVNVK